MTAVDFPLPSKVGFLSSLLYDMLQHEHAFYDELPFERLSTTSIAVVNLELSGLSMGLECCFPPFSCRGVFCSWKWFLSFSSTGRMFFFFFFFCYMPQWCCCDMLRQQNQNMETHELNI
jgi:hypothetical protein